MEFFISAKNIPVHLSDSGKGKKTILLLHGYLETLYIWSEFSKLLEDKEYRVISLDIPGHGLSGFVKPEVSMEFIAELMNEVLIKQEIESCIVAGHSMGGYIAQYFAKLFPEKCEELILLNSTPYKDSPEKLMEREMEIKMIEEGKLLVISSLSIPNMFSSSSLRRLDDKIIETITICETHSPEGIVCIIRGMMLREDNTNLLSELKIPLKIVMGSEDRYISAEKIEELQKELKNARIHVIEGTGHSCFLEAPEATIELVF